MRVHHQKTAPYSSVKLGDIFFGNDDVYLATSTGAVTLRDTTDHKFLPDDPVLNYGKIKCCEFGELKDGDVFNYCYIKQGDTAYNMLSGNNTQMGRFVKVISCNLALNLDRMELE